MKTLTSIALLGVALLAGCWSTPTSDADLPESLSVEDSRAALLENSSPRSPQLEALEPLVGTFRTRLRFRGGPEQPWGESTGTCTNRWIEDGRFLESHARGPSGEKQEGTSRTGYDSARGEFVLFTLDSPDVVVTPIRRGTADATGSVITYPAEKTEPYFLPWTRIARIVQSIAEPNAHAHQWYARIGDEPEFLMISMECSR
jgi:hypothetical protein